MLVEPRLIPVARELCEQTILKYVNRKRIPAWRRALVEQRNEAERLIREALIREAE